MIYDEVKYLVKVATARSKEARQLEKVKRTFDKAYQAQKNTVQTDGVRYSLKIKRTDGSVEELADARELTSDQAIDYLKQAKKGSLKWNSYIPVRKDTPQVIIDTLESVGENVDNLSLVMQVRKAQQAMSLNHKGTRSIKTGNNKRPHALQPEEILEIISNLDDPGVVILQTNRQNTNGDPLPNNVAVFVEYSSNGRESVAVVEFDSFIDPDFIGTEFGDTKYHTVVTVFEPDTERNGMPFDYVDELLSNPDNYELDIVKRQSEGSVVGKKHPNTSNELSSKNSIPQNSQKSSGNSQKSLSTGGEQIVPAGNYNVYGKDIALASNDIAPPVPETRRTEDAPKVGDDDFAPIRKDVAPPAPNEAAKEYISMAEFANSDSSVWKNVAYDDEETKANIMRDTHDHMVADGAVVAVSEEVRDTVDAAYPDLRGMKKKERTPILKEAMQKLKVNLRQFLSGFKNQNFEFDVHGKLLEAKLYNTGINEVLEKITKEKAGMLYSTESIFKNARYMYSSPDYDGDPNVYRWNYFYTPVQFGEETVGVRIAVRDTATPRESQIYNWGIKKNTSLDGVGRGTNDRISHGVSSDVSTDSISDIVPSVKMDMRFLEGDDYVKYRLSVDMCRILLILDRAGVFD